MDHKPELDAISSGEGNQYIQVKFAVQSFLACTRSMDLKTIKQIENKFETSSEGEIKLPFESSFDYKAVLNSKDYLSDKEK